MLGLPNTAAKHSSMNTLELIGTVELRRVLGDTQPWHPACVSVGTLAKIFRGKDDPIAPFHTN